MLLGEALADALALRDGFAAQNKLVTAVADSAAGHKAVAWARQLRSELQQPRTGHRH